MTNTTIIAAAAVQAGIFSESEAETIIKSGHLLPLHTFAEWKRMGYIVKKGEKARMKCDIWRKSTKKQQAENGEEEEENGRFYKKLAHFFTIDQVERITA